MTPAPQLTEKQAAFRARRIEGNRKMSATYKARRQWFEQDYVPPPDLTVLRPNEIPMEQERPRTRMGLSTYFPMCQ